MVIEGKEDYNYYWTLECLQLNRAILGSTTIELEFEGKKHTHRFYVTNQISYDGIIGLDFMKNIMMRIETKNLLLLKTIKHLVRRVVESVYI